MKPLLMELVEKGFRISNEVIDLILKSAGEID
ncbi:hypothetical protein [Thermococcus sp.]